MGRNKTDRIVKKMTANNSLKWLRGTGPNLRAASVKGNIPMLQDNVVQKAISSPAYKNSESMIELHVCFGNATKFNLFYL